MNGEGEVLQKLSARQREVLRELLRFYAANGEPPSLRFVARRLGIHHSVVQEHLEALHRKGWLRAPTTDGVQCAHELEASPEPSSPRQ